MQGGIARQESHVRVRRGFLFWGIFFVCLGAIPVAARLGWFDPGRFTDLGRLWPIALIAIGLGILLARSRLRAVMVVVAAIVLGSVSGLALAAGNVAILGFGDCAAGNASDLQHKTLSGTFSEPASVTLRANCSKLTLVTQPGSDWSLQAAYRADPPGVVAGAASLSVESPTNGLRYQEWSLGVPAGMTRTIDLQSNAGTASLDLGAGNLSALTVEGNAGDILINAPDTPIADLHLSINAGRARVTLGASTSGALSVNAGSIDLCTAAGAEVVLDVPDHFAFETNLGGSGLNRIGNSWRRAGSGGPTIDLRIDGNAASFNLDPAGGCR
jgi:hypothetical protein